MIRPLRWAVGAAVVLFVACSDGTEPLRPTTLEVSQPPATADAGTTVTPAPTVRVLDQNGDPMVGIGLSIQVTSGGGTIEGAPTQSAETAVPIGSWTLGPTVAGNSLQISVEGLDPVTLNIQTTAGPPAAITVLPPDSALIGEVGEALDPAPRVTVTDQFGNPVSGATISLSVDGGTIPGTVTTDSAGVATLAGWTLGTQSGNYTATLTVGSASTTLVAVAEPGPPASLDLISGGGQAAVAGGTVRSIRFQVQDRFANGISGIAVSFAIAAGGGSLRGSSATTDASGTVTAPDWSLGLSAVPQLLRASAAGFTEDAPATVQTSFDIELRFYGQPMSPERKDIFRAAANRIRGVVIGDLSSVSSTGIDPSACGADGATAPTGSIDDLIIYATIASGDGVGGVLASAGPCYVRNGPGLPVVGVMEFDEADIAALQQRGTLRDVVMHEMLHVLGVGVGLYWDPYLSGEGSTNPRFSGTAANQGCRDSGGSTACPGSVPVENTGGAGTADSHWRESVFNEELMTGYAESGAMPFSRITIGSLQDIGYTVNFVATDDYSVPFFSSRAEATEGGVATDRVRAPTFTILPSGDVRPLGGREIEP